MEPHSVEPPREHRSSAKKIGAKKRNGNAKNFSSQKNSFG
jgi:hypothetical protein